MTTTPVTCLSAAYTDNDRFRSASSNGTAVADFLLIANAHGVSTGIRKAIIVTPGSMPGNSAMLANYSRHLVC